MPSFHYPFIPNTNPKHYFPFATHLSPSLDVIVMFCQYKRKSLHCSFKMKNVIAKKKACHVLKSKIMKKKKSSKKNMCAKKGTKSEKSELK